MLSLGKHRDKFWDHDWPTRSRIMGRSAGRVNHLFGLKHWVDYKVVNLTEIDTTYGFGDKRTVEQYLEWTHVNLRNKTAPSNCPNVLAGKLQLIPWNESLDKEDADAAKPDAQGVGGISVQKS